MTITNEITESINCSSELWSRLQPLKQPVRLLGSASPNQSVNSVFLSKKLVSASPNQHQHQPANRAKVWIQKQLPPLVVSLPKFTIFHCYRRAPYLPCVFNSLPLAASATKRHCRPLRRWHRVRPVFPIAIHHELSLSILATTHIAVAGQYGFDR